MTLLELTLVRLPTILPTTTGIEPSAFLFMTITPGCDGTATLLAGRGSSVGADVVASAFLSIETVRVLLNNKSYVACGYPIFIIE